MKSQINQLKQIKLLQLISGYKSIKDISKELNIKENSVYVTRKRYIKRGLLNKDNTLTSKGFDTLRTTIGYLKTVKSTVKSDTIRLHNLVFTIDIQHLKNWKNRREFLELKCIKFEELGLSNWQGERIIVDNTKIWLTNKRIILYMSNYYGKDNEEDSNIVFKRALDDLMFNYIPRLEQLLKINLRGLGGYNVRVSRNHYALMKNALADKYYQDNKKLYIRKKGELWLVIDNSLNLKELETVSSKNGREDNIIVQDFFNDLKDNPIVPSEIIQGFNQFGSALKDMKKNALIPLTKQIKLHLEVQRETLITLKKIQEKLDK